MPPVPEDDVPPTALPVPFQSTQPVAEAVATIESWVTACLPGMAVEPASRRPRGRPRVLPSLALWAGLLVCVVRGIAHQRGLWRLLASGGFWGFPPLPISDEAVYRRLEQEGTAPLQALFTHVSTVLASRLDPLVPASFRGLAAFATDVVAIDEMTLDQVARTVAGLRALPEGAKALLGGRLAGRFNLRRQQWERVLLRPDAAQNEKVAAPALVADLAPGTLVVADLGYFAFRFAFRWFDDLMAAGLWWVARLRAKTSYALRHVYYQDGETRMARRSTPSSGWGPIAPTAPALPYASSSSAWAPPPIATSPMCSTRSSSRCARSPKSTPAAGTSSWPSCCSRSICTSTCSGAPSRWSSSNRCGPP